MIFSLANELGKFAREVEETITDEELIKWEAFFELRAEEQKKAARKSR